LSEITIEGYLYRVDLRLRPEGRMGDITYSLDGFRRYYYSRGKTWERLALLKAFPVAGDKRLGTKFLEMVAAFIYEQPFDIEALAEIRSMKKQIVRKMAAGGEQRRNVKLGFGGIREIELIVQALQLSHSQTFGEIRNRNTLAAIEAIFSRSLLTGEERERLIEAYLFLRDVENKLQMVNDSQTHTIPVAAGELNTFARMMGYPDDAQASASDRFLSDYRLHTNRVNAIFEKTVGSKQ
jgi:glutamate-ammonia-ligase adenylyltransferase